MNVRDAGSLMPSMQGSEILLKCTKTPMCFNYLIAVDDDYAGEEEDTKGARKAKRYTRNVCH